MENEHLRFQIKRFLQFSGWSSRKLSLEAGLQKDRIAWILRRHNVRVSTGEYERITAVMRIMARAANGPKTKIHDLFLLADGGVGRVTKAAVDSFAMAWSWSGLPGKDPETMGELLSKLPLERIMEIAASKHPRGQTPGVRAAMVEIMRAVGYEFEVSYKIIER